jgi:cell division protein FtsB
MNRAGWMIFFLVIVYFIFLIRQDIINNRGLKEEESRLVTNLRKEELQQKLLVNRLQALKNNSCLEELARTKLGFIKKGETAYKVILGGEK